MGIRFQKMLNQAVHIVVRPHQYLASSSVPKGHLAVYVGEEEKMKKNRFVVPISYLKHPLFQDLLRKAEEEYGFDHPMGGLTIPCSEHVFMNLTSQLNGLHH